MSHHDPHPAEATGDQVGLQLTWEKATRTKTRVKADFDGKLIHSHQFDLGSATARLNYAKEVVAKIDGKYKAEIEPGVIEEKLLAAAEELAGQAIELAEDEALAGYQVVDDDTDPERNGLYRQGQDGLVQLSNFVMLIVKDTIIRDGHEVRHQFEGTIRLHGKTTTFSITSEQFASNEQLRAAIFAAAGPKVTILTYIDALRVAISRVSAPETKYFTTDFGWTEDGTAYLVPGGRIDAEGFHPVGEDEAVPVDLGDEEGARWLGMTPLESTKLIEVKRHIVDDLMRLHVRAVMFPILAAVALAILARFARGTQRLAVWLKGRTGAGKSFAAKLAMNFFGNFSELIEGTRFGNWGSTAYYIQRQGYFFKDALYLVDDYKPEVISQKDAVYILQNYADGTGRGRLRKDATTNTTRPIRGLMLCTGEDLPQNNPSALARTILLDVPQAVKDLERGARCLAACRDYSGVMADFIRWLLAEGRTQHFAERVEHHQKVYYARIAGQQNDARIAGNFARLAAAFEEFARYLGDVWPDWEQRAGEFTETILVEALDEMLGIVKSQQASEIFLETLRMLLNCGRVQVKHWHRQDSDLSEKGRPLVGRYVVGTTARPQPGTHSGTAPPRGFSAGEAVFEINIPLAMEEVQQSLRKQGRPDLKVTETTLLDQLAEDGKLVDRQGKPLRAKNEGRKTKVSRIGRAVLNVARIPVKFFRATPEQEVASQIEEPGADDLDDQDVDERNAMKEKLVEAPDDPTDTPPC